MSGKKLVCECNCGRSAYFNKMVEVVVERAIDHTLRQTQTAKRFLVLKQCKEPFEEELAMKFMLQQIAQAWQRKLPLSPWRWVNPFHPMLLFVNWIRRINAARRVMRLQHAIFERTLGFSYARKRAVNSAVLFGAPRWMQGFLARRFSKGLDESHRKAIEARDAKVAFEEVES